MNRRFQYSIAFVFLFLSFQVKAEDTLHSVFRPRLGAGVGTLTYYGEVQNQMKGFSPLVNRYAGVVYVNAPLTPFFNWEFSATYGKIAANERTLYRNFNFESRIRMASFHLYYNFYPLFKKERGFFNPYVGVGVSSFEFLSKTDMYSRQGEMYHYWSDGSIKNLSENDPNAANAIDIERDYRYETDLRDLDLDSLGKYREQSFGFPLSAGFEFHLSPRWDFRIGLSYYLTLTDLIDNISPAGTGIRQGDKNKDRLVFTYFSLSYDLQFGKKEGDGMDEEDAIPLFADWDQNDSDQDGVIDALDACAATPIEAIVDSLGCPKDDDQDGVPNYRDDERNTPEGNFVDEYGVTLTEEQIARHWELYNDSTGYAHDFNELRTIVKMGPDEEFGLNDVPKKGQNYVVIIGKEQKDISANELHQYLGFKDYQTITRGDTVYYVIGEYDDIEDAVAAKTGLENSGVDVEVVGRNNVENGSMTPVDDEVIAKVEKINEKDGKEIPTYGGTGKVFRVQIGAFKNKVNLDKSSIGRLPELTYGTGSDGLTRYYSGNFQTYEEAEAHRKSLISKHKRAFVVAYEGEERKALQDVVEEKDLPESYDPNKEQETFVDQGHKTDSKVDLSKAEYHILLATSPPDENLDIEVLNVLRTISGVVPVKSFDGTTNYYSPAFDYLEERNKAMKEYKKTYDLDLNDPAIKYEGKYYSPSEWSEFLKNNQ